MKVLITGAAGYLGQGMISRFEANSHVLRLMDVKPSSGPHEMFAGSVADLETVRKAVVGMDAIVIAHMAPRPTSYETPEACFDINVKGTANLFFAAHEAGIKRVVLISSLGVLGTADGRPQPRSFEVAPKGLYSLTKACQESIAHSYHRETGVAVAILRVGYVMDEDSLTDKYGRKISARSPRLSDRRDIGEVACRCLVLPDLGCEVFHVISVEEGGKDCDLAFTCDRLKWKPAHGFRHLPLAQK